MLSPKHLLILPLVILFAVFLLSAPVLAEECHLLDSSVKILEGFGAPYNVFSDLEEPLIKVDCGPDMIDINIGNDSSATWIYNTGYIHKDGRWERLTYSGDNKIRKWFIGQAGLSLPVSQFEINEPVSILAYVCTRMNNKWKCGCTNRNCLKNFWQLQIFRIEEPCDTDHDYDGYGNPASDLCRYPELDCDDDNKSVNPGAEEICDGIDNNCNGIIDENCSCIDGDDRSCGQDTGECQSGVQTCVNGSWTECEGAIMPTDEICDGKDNDCDGEIDEGIDCCVDLDGDGYGNPASELCRYPELDCDDTKWFMNPGAPETCDNYDNNCDGEIDEGCDDDDDGYCDSNIRFYNYPVAACPLTNVPADSFGDDCNDGNGKIYPGAGEICDGIDNDCDGEIDEDCYLPTSPYKILKTPVPPLIDGQLGEFIGVNQINLSNSRGTAGSYRLLYDSTALYVAVDVADSELNAVHFDADGKLWEDDSVELFFDTLHNAGASMGTDDYKFFVNLNNIHTDSQGNWDYSWTPDFTSAVARSAAGYTIEFFVSWDKWGINPPNAGSTWGFDLSLNDRDNAGTPLQTTWTNSDGNTSNNPDGWGDMLFSSQSVVRDTQAPVVTAFDVQPRNTTGSVAAAHTVTDDTALARVELWRAPDNAGAPGNWLLIETQAVSGASHAGQFINTPAEGVWWYGLHVVDSSGNVGNEESLGPVKVTAATPKVCVDNDQDGYGVCPDCGIANGCAYDGDDCDDNESWANPGGHETCDGIDNDCDGAIDEGCDDDSDHYCDQAMQIYRNNTMCYNTPYIEGRDGDDCNDANYNINLGQVEICGNNVDEDCDGVLDNGCDTQNPIITAFDVQPRTTTGSVTASYNVTDNAALARVELWHAPYNATGCNDTSKTGCSWLKITEKIISGTSNSGAMSNTPAAGVWWYGLHAVDAAGNIGYEPGPIKVTASGAFSVTITNPADGAKFQLGESVIFQGIAEGGTSPYNYSWSSSIDGFLGSGQTITIPE